MKIGWKPNSERRIHLIFRTGRIEIFPRELVKIFHLYYQQKEYDIKCEWGLKGAVALSPVSDVLVIVDVLSFSSCVDIAVSNGAIIYPYKFKDESAAEYAGTLNAELAVSRKDSRKGYSLSFASLENIPNGTRLVLPSPNGSSISFAVSKDIKVICGCLRNSKAVAEYASANFKKITLIPSGEMWEPGSLRPSLEDTIGAGAIISNLKGTLSPESKMALAVYNQFKGNLLEALKNCVSGKELIERDYEEDVKIASELNVSNSVPVLTENAYINKEAEL